MARLTIDTGTAGNPATGDTLRTAMTKANTNFEEIYSLVGDGSTGLITTSITNGDLKLQANGAGAIEIDTLSITNSTITSTTTNSNITLTPNGTGSVVVNTVSIRDNTISTNASNADLELSANGTGQVVVDAPLKINSEIVLGASENDGSTTAIDLTKPVAILEGDSRQAQQRTYVLNDGTYTGQLMYLVRGTDGGVAGTASATQAIFVTVGKLVNSSGIFATNATFNLFTQYSSMRICVWRGDCWVFDRVGD